MGVTFMQSGRFGGGVDPGLSLLQSAALWLDASDMASGAEWIRNKGTGGRSLDARVGSVGSAQIINGALKIPYVAGNNASTPDSAALDITGDIEMVVRVSLLDWTPAAIGTFIGKRTTTAANFAYQFRINTSGVLHLRYGDSSTTDWGVNSTVAPTVADGGTLWLKVTRASASGDVKFYTAADQSAEPSSWTQLGATVANPATAINTNTFPLFIGDYASGGFEQLSGTVFRAIVRNGIGGTTVFDADFTAQSTLATSFTESSSNAATVTINSTTGVDTNDPLLLPHTGTNYLYLPGIGGNYATTPDSAALGITGDIDLRCRVAYDDWTPSVDATMISKDNGTREFNFYIGATTGRPALYWWDSGATFTQVDCSAAPVVADGAELDMRVTLDVDNGASGRDVKFWTKSTATPLSDNSGWTQLGTTSTAAGVSSIRNTADPIGIGGRAGGNLGAGKFYRAMILDGIGGTVALDANFSTNTGQTTFTESSPNAATVTINRATSGRKAVVVVRPTLLFGTDDYLEVADNALLNFAAADSMTVLAVGRTLATQGTNDAIVAKKANVTDTTAGWLLANHGTTALQLQADIGDGTLGTSATSASRTDGTAALWAMVRSVGGDTLTTFIGSTAGTPVTDATTATLTNTEVVRVGRLSGAGTEYFDGEIMHVAVFRSALTSTELGQIATYLGV